MRVIKFRAWTGKKLIYQEKQYLASFIRRIVPEIIRDHGGEAFSQHESYLPNGGVIDEYLMQYTTLKDKNGKEIYEGDIVRRGYLALNDVSKFGLEPWLHLPEGVEESDITTTTEIWVVGCEISDLQKISEAVLSNPDVLGVEIIGNVYEHPGLLAASKNNMYKRQ